VPIFGSATLIGAKIGAANLSLADLSGATFSRVDLDNADLSGATLNKTNFSAANLSNAQLTGVQWQWRTMRGCYPGIRVLDSCFGNALFKRAAADQDFLDTLEDHLRGSRRMALFRIWGWIDYGRSLIRVAAISFGLVAIYGAICRIFPQILDFKESANTWFTPYYFSIVTYTTLGFGDVRPATVVGELIVSSEVISATRRSVCSVQFSRKASRAAAETQGDVLLFFLDSPPNLPRDMTRGIVSNR
jgi:hypothetical protein